MPHKQQIALSINPLSGVDKYRQLVDGIIDAVRTGSIRRGEALPTVGYFCKSFGLSKETVLKAYTILRTRGIVTAIPRKGYFVATESVEHKANVLLLFDEFPDYKQVLYDQFIKTLKGKALVDLMFHHCRPALFESLLLDNIKDYDLAVVMPFADKTVGKVLEQVDPKKVLLLDRREHADERFSFIGQEFEEQTYQGLMAASELLSKYKAFYLVFPHQADVAIKSSQAPREIIKGFKRFCREQRLPYHLSDGVAELPVKKGDAIFLIDDADLVTVVEVARAKQFRLGADVGILSFNDSPVKRVIDRGITVLSTDFAAMGRRAAEYVLAPKRVNAIQPTALIRRQSL
jgi:DNA-binding transcriptional regulator YhcF (GntR family)